MQKFNMSKWVKLLITTLLIVVWVNNVNATYIQNPDGIWWNELRLWLESTSWVTGNTDWAKISLWTDKSWNGFDVSQDQFISQPTYSDNTTSNINFLPVVSFPTSIFTYLDFHTGFDVNWNNDYTLTAVLRNNTFSWWTFVETITYDEALNLTKTYYNWVNQSYDPTATWSINIGDFTSSWTFAVWWYGYEFDLAEVLVYNKELPIEDIQVLESYLALKYWVAFEWNESLSHDYYDSNKNIIWVLHSNTGLWTTSNYYSYWYYDNNWTYRYSTRYFSFNTTWIVRDDALWLNVTKSKNQNYGYWLVTIEKTNALNNMEHLLISDTWSSVDWDLFDAPVWYSLVSRRWSTQWTSDNIKLTFDVDNLALNIPAPVDGSSNYYFIYDADLDWLLADESPLPMSNDWWGNYSISWLSLSDRQDFTIASLWEYNFAPRVIKIDDSKYSDRIELNTLTWSVIWNLSVVDENSLDTHTYALVAWTGSEDNAFFSISWNSLSVNFSADYANPLDANLNNVYNILVEVTDNWGLTYQDTFYIYVNQGYAPTDLTIDGFDALHIDENNSLYSNIWTLIATDPDTSDTHYFNLVTWTWDEDNNLFYVDYWPWLETQFVADYEVPQDANGDNTYNIRVETTDAEWNKFSKALTIVVDNVNETNVAPTNILINGWSSPTIDENEVNWFVFWNLSTTDANTWDTHSYTLTWWIGSDDNWAVTISWTSVSLNTSHDYENPADAGADNMYAFRVSTTDALWLTFEKAFILSVNDVAESSSPYNLQLNWWISVTIDENTPSWTNICAFTSDDLNVWDLDTYCIVDWTWDEDNGLFILSWNNLQLAFTPDFEIEADANVDNTYNIRVRATDSDSLTTEAAFTVVINDVNEAINNAPTDIKINNLDTISIDENITSWTNIWTVSVIDPDIWNTHTYTLVNWIWDEDNSNFTLVATTLSLAITPDFENPVDANNNNVHRIRLRVTDNFWLSFEKTFNITVNDIFENTAPSDLKIAGLDAIDIAENTSTWANVWALSNTDIDNSDTHTYSLAVWAWDTDNGLFRTHLGSLFMDFKPDFENPVDTGTNNQYNIRLKVTDNSWAIFEKAFIISITDVFENTVPTDTKINSLNAISVNENITSWSNIWTLSVVDGDIWDTYTYSLLAWTWDEDNTRFTISWNSLRLAFTPNFESPIDSNANNIYNIRIRVTDSGWLTFDKAFTVTVLDVNETVVTSSWGGWSSWWGGWGWAKVCRQVELVCRTARATSTRYRVYRVEWTSCLADSLWDTCDPKTFWTADAVKVSKIALYVSKSEKINEIAVKVDDMIKKAKKQADDDIIIMRNDVVKIIEEYLEILKTKNKAKIASAKENLITEFKKFLVEVKKKKIVIVKAPKPVEKTEDEGVVKEEWEEDESWKYVSPNDRINGVWDKLDTLIKAKKKANTWTILEMRNWLMKDLEAYMVLLQSKISARTKAIQIKISKRNLIKKIRAFMAEIK